MSVEFNILWLHRAGLLVHLAEAPSPVLLKKLGKQTKTPLSFRRCLKNYSQSVTYTFAMRLDAAQYSKFLS